MKIRGGEEYDRFMDELPIRGRNRELGSKRRKLKPIRRILGVFVYAVGTTLEVVGTIIRGLGLLLIRLAGSDSVQRNSGV